MKVKNVQLLVATIIYAILYGIIGEIFYTSLIEEFYKPLVIGVYFFMFSAGLFAVIYFISRTKQNLFSVHIVRDTTIALLIVFIASTLLEIIYEIGGKYVYNEPTSYIFLIDDSGSMSTNDPEAERINAIATVMNNKSPDFRYAVYLFDSDYHLVRNMAPKSEGLGQIDLKTNGGTGISTTIKGVLNDIETGKIDGGDYPKILLLSDGYSSDSFLGTINIRKELKKLQKLGISISTVGLGNSVDRHFMGAIAKKTGGVYINVDDISDLSTAMKKAITSQSGRDLLGVRPRVNFEWLYSFLRILFVFIIASLILVVKCLGCGGSDFNKILIINTFLNFVAALLLEIGLNYAVFNGLVVHIVMCVLIAVIMNYYIVYSHTIVDDESVVKKNFDDSVLKNKDKKQDYTSMLN